MKVFRKSIIIALCCAHQGAMAWSLISLSKDTCRTPFSFFSFQQNWTPQSTGSQVSHRPIDNFKQSSTLMASLMFASVILMGSPVLADEYGVEKEAPTIFTGETVEVRNSCESLRPEVRSQDFISCPHFIPCLLCTCRSALSEGLLELAFKRKSERWRMIMINHSNIFLNHPIFRRKEILKHVLSQKKEVCLLRDYDGKPKRTKKRMIYL